MYRKFKRHFRAATQPHASAPSLAAIAAAPARSGSGPQPGGARQSAAWTCCVGWVRLKPQGFLGAKPSGRAAEESRGGQIQTGLQTRRGVVRSRDTPLLHARRPRGHARRCEPVGCTAHRTGGQATSPTNSATQSNLSWRERAGAMGGGSAESFRWRRIFRITSPWVIAAMIRSAPRWQNGQMPISSANTRLSSRAQPQCGALGRAAGSSTPC